MKIYLDTIGCRLNQSEIERFGRDFRQAGHELTARPEEADIAVINTCAVTAKAASDSRAKARWVGKNVRETVILTGCWSTLEPQKALSIPNVSEVIANAEKDGLVQRTIPGDPIDSNDGLLGREPLPGLRRRTRAFIKVQDGCDLRCTYCITTIARGTGRSLPADKVIEDIRYAVRGGVKEVILTGVHLGSWGHDLKPRRGLKHLILEILAKTNIPRIRLSSLEAWDLAPDFFSLWEDHRLCRHLHLPLQSGSNRILQRMARRTTTSDYVELVTSARVQIPDVAITTDIITGFPGETIRDFELSRQLVEQLSFSGGHVFTYSERNGTAAAGFNGRVPTKIRKARSALLRKILKESSHRFCARHLGSEQLVLWEGIAGSGPEGYELKGWTDNYIRVELTNQQVRSNEVSRVRLLGFNDNQSSMFAALLD